MSSAGPKLKIAQIATADMSIRILLLDQIQALQAAGYDVTAICAPGAMVEDVRAQGVKVHTVAMARELSPIADLRSLLTLYRYFRRERFDVVHSHTPKAGLLAPLAAQWAGVPCVVHTIHGLLFHDRMPAWRRRLFWIPEKITAGFCDRLLSQSREDIEVAVRTRLCHKGKIAYIGNGIDVRRFSPDGARGRAELRARLGFTPHDVVVGSVGRLVYDKGFGEFFAAVEALSARYDHVRFVVIGPREPEQNDAVEDRRIDQLQARGAVHFLDWRDDMPSWYSVMDIFVMASHREGIPRACMEAAAMHLPVVTTDIRGCREVVHHEETGLLVRVKDAESLLRAIVRLVEDPAARSRMGEAGRRLVVSFFNQEQVLDRLIQYYNALERDWGGNRA